MSALRDNSEELCSGRDHRPRLVEALVTGRRPIFGLDEAYFVIRRLVAVAEVGASGEIANVSHVLQPGARLAASKSP